MASAKTRRSFLVAAGSGATAAIAGCSGSPSNNNATTTKNTTTAASGANTTTTKQTNSNATGGTLQLVSNGKIKSLDPIQKGTGGINQWAEGLITFNHGLLPPKPQLATGYKTSNGGKTYTFSLKTDVTFQNGKKLTASDFVYSWERIAQSPHTQNVSDIIGGTFTIAHKMSGSGKNKKYVPGSLATKAVDKHTFQFTLADPFHAALSSVAQDDFFVIPEGFVGDITRSDVNTKGKYSYQEAFETKNGGPKVVGTGPFKVDTWSQGGSLTLSKYDNYWGKGPHIDGIKYTIVGSANALYTRAKNGNVDIWNSIPSAKFRPKSVNLTKTLKGGRKAGTYQIPGGPKVGYGETTALRTVYALFNCKRTKKAARHAIAWLINQHEIAKSVYSGGVEPAYTVTPSVVFPNLIFPSGTTHQQAYEAFVKSGSHHQTKFGKNGYPYGYNEANIQKAKQIMENAGYSASNPYKITFTIYAGDSQWKQIANLIQSKGKAAHIDVTINTADYNTIISQGGFKHKLDFFSLSDSMEWPEADNFMRFLPPKDAMAKSGFSQWGRKKNGKWATDAMRVAQNTWDQDYKGHKGPGKSNRRHRDKAYLTIEETNWEAMQELPIVYPKNRNYWSSDVQNYEPPGVMQHVTYNKVRLNRQ